MSLIETGKIMLTGMSIFISLIALTLSIISYRYNKTKNHISLAIELAKEYEYILNNYVPIFALINEHQDIQGIINKIDLNKLSRFDRSEIEEIIPSTEERKKLHAFFIDFDGINEEKTRSVYIKDNMTMQNTSSIRYEELQYYVRIKNINILNSLECFSMAFVHNIAQDKVVYRSLHQSFFDIIRVYYYKIAYSNISSKDCYYTNIINLFEHWKSVDLYLQNEENSSKRTKPVIKAYWKKRFKNYK